MANYELFVSFAQRTTVGCDTASEEHVEFPSGTDNTRDAEMGKG